MTPRIQDPYKIAPEAINAQRAVEAALKNSGLEPDLMELVRTRASQINGCAYCLHMHTTDARKLGETEMRLYLLSAWRESSLYSPRERAALAWTEALTLLPQTGAPDADYELVKEQFTEAEQINLTFLIGSINLWNRFAVGLRAQHPKGNQRVAA